MRKQVFIFINLPQEEFLLLLELCSRIFDRHVEWSIENKTCNRRKAHESLYADVRKDFPQVPSALVQTTRDNALALVKANKFRGCRFPGVKYDYRTLTLDGDQIAIAGVEKRKKFPIEIPESEKYIFNWKFECATLSDSEFGFTLNFEFRDSNPDISGKDLPELIKQQTGFEISVDDLYRMNSKFEPENKFSLKKEYSQQEYEDLVMQLTMPVANSFHFFERFSESIKSRRSSP